MQWNYEQGPLTNDGQDGSWLQDEKEAGHCFSSFKVPAHLLRDIINWLSRGFPLRISFMSFFCMLEFYNHFLCNSVFSLDSNRILIQKKNIRVIAPLILAWLHALKCPCDQTNHFLFFLHILKVCLLNTGLAKSCALIFIQRPFTLSVSLDFTVSHYFCQNWPIRSQRVRSREKWRQKLSGLKFQCVNAITFVQNWPIRSQRVRSSLKSRDEY